MNANETNLYEKTKRPDMITERGKKRRYSKWKLLELRKSKRCQEWPKVLNKRFVGIDGKWDPVGAFENSTSYPHRTQSRDDIQHFYNERYRKRQRDDYKYYWYGENNKRYNSYTSNHPHYYSNSKKRYDYEEDASYDGTGRSRASPVDYYPSYSYQMPKTRSTTDKDSSDTVANDNKPEWFTGGPSNINETIELSGMSRELEAGILKSRKPTRKLEELFPKSPDTEDVQEEYKTDDASQLDSHLMKIIKKNAKEKDKRKNASSAKEVEKVLKSILLRPNELAKESTTLSQNSNGVVRTVNEIEANLKLKGNRGAGDMSAYYKLLGLVQNNFTIGQNEDKPTQSNENKSTNHSETSTNNNHPRQFTNSKYPITSGLKSSRNILKMSEESELEAMNKINDVPFTDVSITDSKDKSCKESLSDLDGINGSNSSTTNIKYDENIIGGSEFRKINGFNNFNIHANNMRNDRFSMSSRNVCNPLTSQFSNHMLGTGQNAYRWIRAMNNAAAASARMTQMNQVDNSNPIDSDSKLDMKSDQEMNSSVDCSTMDSFGNIGQDNTYRSSLDPAISSNQLGSYVNTYNYVTPGSPLYNQMPMKPFFPYNFAQNSVFGRQFLNPYLFQQLFLHKQWENRNISLQNQLRQFQSMVFNSSNSQNIPNTSAPAYSTTSSNLPLNQGDCSAISVSK